MTERVVQVLIVEDDRELRGILARHLASLGYRVAEADSAEEARDLFEAGTRPRLVLLDLNLPGDTGWDLLRGDAFARAGRPPVVVTTATTVNPRRLAEFGVVGYLPKPFPLATLVATIERVLAASSDRAPEGASSLDV